MPRLSQTLKRYRAKQRAFIFSGRSAKCGPVSSESIFDASHIRSQTDRIADLLKNFKRYRNAEAKFPGGAIFYGPAGTGKTMMARHVATQSGARFIDMRQFPVILSSGVHAWQSHDIQHLFALSEEWARKNNRPAVIFIDQFDDWLEINKSVLSQLEIELDGFSGRREGVYFIATAKEAPEDFGKSLFRSGRIEMWVAFSRPDRNQQLELIRGFLSRYPHDPGIDLDNLIYLLRNPSPADLESFVDEAYVHVLREKEMARVQGGKRKSFGKAKVTEASLLQTLIYRVLDPETGHTMTAEEERVTAIHEVGHYVVARALGVQAHFVSCKPGLRSLGMTFIGDNGLERKNPSIDEIHRLVSVCTAGTEAEIFFGVPPSTSGGGDNDTATSMLQTTLSTGIDPKSPLVKEYGVMCFGDTMFEDTDLERPSKKFKAKLEKAIGSFLKKEQIRARRVIKFFGRKMIGEIADMLRKRPGKVMLQRELDGLLEPKLSQFRKKHRITDLMARKS